TEVDRDLFSAFLVRHCTGGELDERAAREDWAAWGADCLLRPSSGDVEAASVRALPGPGREERPRSGSAAVGAGQRREAGARRRLRRAPRRRSPRSTPTRGSPVVGTPGL